MTSKPAKMSQFSRDIIAARHKIHMGTMLVIDPSSGSRDSMPGFAYFEKGILQECGSIHINRKDALFRKLYNLASILRERFPKVDVLVIENIAPYMSSGGTDFRNKALVNLHKSIGTVLGAVEAEFIVEVSPMTWHSWLRKKELHDNYEKSDTNDALCMGVCTLEEAGVEVDINDFLIEDTGDANQEEQEDSK